MSTGKIKKETVALQGVSVTRVTFGVGAKWSNDLKDYAGTDSCQLPHVALVLSGALRVIMDDGSQQDFSRNDVMLLPPGHDAWSLGNEPCVFVEFSRGNDSLRRRPQPLNRLRAAYVPGFLRALALCCAGCGSSPVVLSAFRTERQAQEHCSERCRRLGGPPEWHLSAQRAEVIWAFRCRSLCVPR